MDLDGLGLPGPGSVGPVGAKQVPALIALDEALLLLGIGSAAGAVEVRSAHRAALGALQAQLQAGTLDRPSFRALTGRLDAALRTALAATRAPGPAPSGPGGAVAQPTSGSLPAAGSSPPATPPATAPIAPPTSTQPPTQPPPPAPLPAEPPDPTGIGPVQGGSAPAGSTGPASTADATIIALKTMPLMNHTPPTRAQHDLWTAVLVPAARQHVEAATALAATTPARTDPQLAAVVTHVALTLALAELPRDARRALLPLAAGVYQQLEAVLPNLVLAGLPPRDLLGGLPLQLWTSGPEVRLTALVLALALVAFAIWAGLR